MTNHRNQLNPPSINTHRPLPFPSTTSPSTRPRTKFLFITIVMTTLLSITFLVTLVLFTSLSSATNRLHHLHRLTARKPHTASPPPPEIQQSCNATRYPSTCISHLSKTNLPQNSTPTDIIQSALTISTSNLKTAQSMVQSILSASTSNLNRTRAAHLCLDILTYSTLRTSASNSALTLGRLKDARAWASAAMSYQYDCWSGLKYVNGTSLVNQTMSFIDTELLVSTSNALSMMLALDSFGNDSGSWSPPRTERDGFWPPASSGGSRRQNVGGDGFWKGLSVNVSVCRDGCDFKTVQAAVDAAPKGLPVGGSGRFVVYIKAGIYKEIVTVRFDQRNLVFLGDGMGKTVITGNLNVGIMGISTYSTATVGVLGDGFMAYGLTFENTAGPPTSQAVAFRSDSDLSYIENCEFLGNQDTLYAHSLRQLYKSCRIEGNVDFIFGNSAAVFQDCTILIRPRQLNPEKGETNAITAHGRTDPAQLTGFSYLNCSVNGTDEYIRMYRSKPGKHRNFLGRPWKEYSRTVFINCNLGEIVSPAGWLPWTGEFALKTLYYGEYHNSGPGASLEQRVPWSSQIPADEVGVYSIDNFIQGDEFSTPTSVVDN